jgi:general secretion pathway protein I
MQIFSRASLTTAASAQYSRAASLVSARLDAVGTAIPLEPGAVSGEPEDGIAWELSIIPVELGLETDGDLLGFGPPVTPYQVTVTALWRDGTRVRRLTLSTLRLGERLD